MASLAVRLVAASLLLIPAVARAGEDDGEGDASGDEHDGAECGDLDYDGRCEGDVLAWCEDGELHTFDCATDGLACEWASEDVGHDCAPPNGGFGYPVGDATTAPAGGWVVTQVLGHWLDAGDFVGGHLAQDVALSEEETADAPVYAIGDGDVLYAGPNASSYVHVVLIRHDLPDGVYCSFYGHLGTVSVTEGQRVARGETIATVLDWTAHFGWPNSHLHYVVLSEELCLASDAADGALVCGYDETAAPAGVDDLEREPAAYTSLGDPCGDHAYPEAFLSPSQFIAARR